LGPPSLIPSRARRRGTSSQLSSVSTQILLVRIGSQSEECIGTAIFDTIESEEERNQFSALQCEYTHLIGQNREPITGLLGAAIFDTIESEEERNQFSALQCEYTHLIGQNREPIRGLHWGRHL